MVIDSPDAMESGMEMAGGSPPAEVDISVGPDVLLTAISVTTVVPKKNAGGMHGDSCRRRETFMTMMLQWLTRLLCRPVIINGLNRTMRMNMEDGLDRSLMTNTDSSRLAVTPGEWYVSETIRMIRTDLRQMNGFMRILGAMCDCCTVGVCPQLDSTAADCGTVGPDDLIFRQRIFRCTSFPPDELQPGEMVTL